MRRNHQTTPARRAPARAAIRFAALLAVFLQAFVAQTHIHSFSAATSSSYERAASGASHSDAVYASAADHRTSCAACEALATGGRAALPSGPALVAFDLVTFETAAVAFSRAPQLPAHPWQSRAPPSFL